MAKHVFSKALQDMVVAVCGYTDADDYMTKILIHIKKNYPLDEEYYTAYYKKLAVVTAQVKSGEEGYVVTLSAFGKTVLHFILGGYPACCGAMMLHHFSCMSLSQEQFNPIMDQLIRELKSIGYLRHTERIITMMVEARNMSGPTIDMELKAVENPNMDFKPLWDYWHTCPKVNTRLMFNVNSGNVLHDMEVILK